MKHGFRLLIATALAFSICAPILSTNAFATKMNGRGYGCSDGYNCQGINSLKGKADTTNNKKPMAQH